jgi:hypothetical protein
MRRRLLSVLVCFACFAAFGIAVWVIDRSQTDKWVGCADLSVEFAVTDADSGQPIPNARINIHCEGGFYDEVEADHKAPFDLLTNGEGIATRLLRNSRVIGSVSRLRFTDTYRIYHTPQFGTFGHSRMGTKRASGFTYGTAIQEKRCAGRKGIGWKSASRFIKPSNYNN